jgi:hypothetical protein
LCHPGRVHPRAGIQKQAIRTGFRIFLTADVCLLQLKIPE